MVLFLYKSVLAKGFDFALMLFYAPRKTFQINLWNTLFQHLTLKNLQNNSLYFLIRTHKNSFLHLRRIDIKKSNQKKLTVRIRYKYWWRKVKNFDEIWWETLVWTSSESSTTASWQAARVVTMSRKQCTKQWGSAWNFANKKQCICTDANLSLKTWFYNNTITYLIY